MAQGRGARAPLGGFLTAAREPVAFAESEPGLRHLGQKERGNGGRPRDGVLVASLEQRPRPVELSLGSQHDAQQPLRHGTFPSGNRFRPGSEREQETFGFGKLTQAVAGKRQQDRGSPGGLVVGSEAAQARLEGALPAGGGARWVSGAMRRYWRRSGVASSFRSAMFFRSNGPPS